MSNHLPTTGTRSRSALDPPQRASARRGGWLFVSSFVLFAGYIVVFSALGGDYDAANQQLADRLGVGVNDVPAAELAPLNRQFQDTVYTVAQLLWGLLAFGLFTGGVAHLARLADQRRGWRVGAVVLGVLPVLCWALVVVLAWLLGASAPDQWIFQVYDVAFFPLLAAIVISGAAALIALVAAVWPTGFARRTSAVAAALAALGAVAAATVGTPPIVALLAGAVLGTGVLLAARGRS